MVRYTVVQVLRRMNEDVQREKALKKLKLLAPPEQAQQMQLQLRAVRLRLRLLRRALGCLTPEQRWIVELLDVNPKKGNCERLCQLLQVEPATVYRRRKKALEKMERVFAGAQGAP